jgi:hypothetical protein
VAITLGRRRIPSVRGFLERHPALPADRAGIAVSTFGKVIKRGWDWLGLAPAAHAQVSGLIEAADLAACLTLSKNDFVRTGPRGATYLAYRKAIQEVVSRQLAEWGDARDGSAHPKTARLERDLERVLEDLSEAFPLLRSLVDRRAGGQKRLPMPGRGDEPAPAPLFASVFADDTAGRSEAPTSTAEGGTVEQTDGSGASRPPAGEVVPHQEAPVPEHEEPGPNAQPHHGRAAASIGALDSVRGRPRPARYGLLVQFESRPDDPELARLVDSTIWINDAHPAYTRAIATRSVGYHTALSVALALAPLAVEASEEHAFITRFMAHWGGSQAGRTAGGRRRSMRRPHAS